MPLPLASCQRARACSSVAGELAVSIVVEGGQGFVAMGPEAPEGDVAEELQAGADFAGVLRIVDEPGGVRVDPAPASAGVGAVDIEGDRGGAVFEIAGCQALLKRNGDRRHGTRQLVEPGDMHLERVDFVAVLLRVEQGDQIYGGFLGDEIAAERACLEFAFFVPAEFDDIAIRFDRIVGVARLFEAPSQAKLGRQVIGLIVDDELIGADCFLEVLFGFCLLVFVLGFDGFERDDAGGGSE